MEAISPFGTKKNAIILKQNEHKFISNTHFKHSYFYAFVKFAMAGNRTDTLASLSKIPYRSNISKFAHKNKAKGLLKSETWRKSYLPPPSSIFSKFILRPPNKKISHFDAVKSFPNLHLISCQNKWFHKNLSFDNYNC